MTFEDDTDELREEINSCERYGAAQAVLAIRGRYPNASLADLYDSLAMPRDLLDAHKRLDKAVDRCYRREDFKTDTERLKFLFECYTALTASEA